MGKQPFGFQLTGQADGSHGRLVAGDAWLSDGGCDPSNGLAGSLPRGEGTGLAVISQDSLPEYRKRRADGGGSRTRLSGIAQDQPVGALRLSHRRCRRALPMRRCGAKLAAMAATVLRWVRLVIRARMRASDATTTLQLLREHAGPINDFPDDLPEVASATLRIQRASPRTGRA